MTKLQLSPDLALPIEAVTERIGFLGRTGQGKSYTAMLLAEQMYAAGAQFVVMDPVGIWHGLRLGRDGKSAGLPIPVLGGLRGDLPLAATAGTVVADLVVDRGTSVVIDVSQFESDNDRVRFATDFAKRLFFRKKAAPSALHIFLEEAQEFVPQNPNGLESFMLNAWLKIAKIGRNYGFGLSFITQRPQEVNKKALNLVELLVAFQLTGSHERKAVQGWISDKDLKGDIEAELPKLQPRHPHVWSPSWLQMSRVVAIGQRTTFDSSATPKVGARAAERPLTPIDLARLQTDMAATIERAKADDPKALKQRIAELEREKSKSVPISAPPQVEVKTVDKPVFHPGDIPTLQKLVDQVSKERESVTDRWTVLLHTVSGLLGTAQQMAMSAKPAPEMVRPVGRPLAPATQRPATTSVAAVRGNDTGNGAVTGPQQRILNALAWLASIGTAVADRGQLAFLADASPKSSSYGNNLGSLRSSGLTDYANGGVMLTDRGHEIADTAGAPQSTEELQESILGKVTTPQQLILGRLIAVYPKSIERGELAEQCGASASSSSYGNNLGFLRTMGLLDYTGGRQVVATPRLFLDGR